MLNGLIYKRFADNPKKYIWDRNKPLPEGYTIIGIDYGGNKSGQAFVCTRISYDFKTMYAYITMQLIKQIYND